MDSETFISVDDHNISLRQALSYLRASGDLQQFLMRILRQHVIEQALQSRTDIEIDPSHLEQAIINFRLQNQLVNPDRFDEWLQSQSINYPAFRNSLAAGLKLDRLKNEITAPKAEEYFNSNQALFEQVVLSRIVVSDKELAEELKRQIVQEGHSFEVLARQHSTTADRILNGMMGAVSFGNLPESIRTAVADANPGDLVGPVEFEGRYSLLRVEQRLPASLEGQLKRDLQEQIFEQWCQAELQNKAVKLNID